VNINTKMHGEQKVKLNIFLVPAEAKDFVRLHIVQTSSEADRASCSERTVRSFPEGNAIRREADESPLYN
jgi:hypothetical protein